MRAVYILADVRCSIVIGMSIHCANLEYIQHVAMTNTTQQDYKGRLKLWKNTEMIKKDIYK